MTESELVELVPARPRLLADGWVSLSTHVVGFAVALPFVDGPMLSVGLFSAMAVLGVALAFAGHRYALRVIVPPPPGAVIVPARFPALADVATVGATVLIVTLALFSTLYASILGFGFGSAFASFWAASKISEFEREGGQQVLRKVGFRFGAEPGLYATP